VWAAAYQDDPGKVGLSEEFLAERVVDKFKPRVVAKIANTLVAVTDTDTQQPVLGFCCLGVQMHEVEQFFLARAARGTGLATELMAAAEARLLQATPEESFVACLHVFEANLRARRFYQRCGWEYRGDCVYQAEISGGRTQALELMRYEKRIAGPSSGRAAVGPPVAPSSPAVDPRTHFGFHRVISPARASCQVRERE
jgi:GNAT superfamily N-acetyltransferase